MQQCSAGWAVQLSRPCLSTSKPWMHRHSLLGLHRACPVRADDAAACAASRHCRQTPSRMRCCPPSGTGEWWPRLLLLPCSLLLARAALSLDAPHLQAERERQLLRAPHQEPAHTPGAPRSLTTALLGTPAPFLLPACCRWPCSLWVMLLTDAVVQDVLCLHTHCCLPLWALHHVFDAAGWRSTASRAVPAHPYCMSAVGGPAPCQ